MIMPTLLLVEDERIIALDLARRLTMLGYTVLATAGSGREAIQQALEHRPDLVLMGDIHLQGEMDGVEAIQVIQAHGGQGDVTANDSCSVRRKAWAPCQLAYRKFSGVCGWRAWPVLHDP